MVSGVIPGRLPLLCFVLFFIFIFCSFQTHEEISEALAREEHGRAEVRVLVQAAEVAAVAARADPVADRAAAAVHARHARHDVALAHDAEGGRQRVHAPAAAPPK